MFLIKICNRIIEYSFYALFLLIPLVFTSNTSELFEFNKMWLAFSLTIIIGACWFIKMILQKRISIQRTPLDIPIVLFLLSQILSTIFSLDIHVSIWGYYSRFNGGLLSIISYIFLYYAFVSNFSIGVNVKGVTRARERTKEFACLTGVSPRRVPAALARTSDGGSERQDPAALDAFKMVKRFIFVSLASGFIVALWGLPSHFGYDPTCLLFRGHFDVSCWTDAFQPKIRIFSTLGQPDWLSAYLAILIPISIVLFLKSIIKQSKTIKGFLPSIFYLLLSALFYLDFLYTRARSGFIALWISLLFFIAVFLWTQKKHIRDFLYQKSIRLGLLILIAIFAIITFFVGTSISQLDKFTFNGLKENFAKKQTVNIKTANNEKPTKPVVGVGELGGTDSGKIRILVWKGAINAWRHYPIFGTGVETFAFAYYKHRPPAHNLVSEWNFLYNKAHNEYLNFLATTGAFGLGSYLFMIGAFLFLAIKKVLQKSPTMNHEPLTILPPALIASYLTILITNFFGFSVVIVNIYLFMIPAFVFALSGMINPQNTFVFPKNELGIKNKELGGANRISGKQKIAAIFIILTSLFMILTLIRFWNADKNYGYGYNLNRTGNYQQAYLYLHKAVSERSNEPVFKDEMAVNDAILAADIIMQKSSNTEAQINSAVESLVKEAMETSSEITSSYPNNILFWKSRTKIFYTLSQVDARYLPIALDAIQKAQTLAPTDANISYNLGVLQGQNNKLDEAIETLKNTVKLKPDYKDAYYALGLFYHQKAIDKNGKVIDSASQKKAIDTMRYILDHIQNNDGAAKQALDAWEK